MSEPQDVWVRGRVVGMHDGETQVKFKGISARLSVVMVRDEDVWTDAPPEQPARDPAIYAACIIAAAVLWINSAQFEEQSVISTAKQLYDEAMKP